jgi:urease accessory protein
MIRRLTVTFAFLGLGAMPAFAHLDPVEHGSLAAGFSHPLSGADHILAMVAVGLWAGLLGGRALWLAPAAFVGTMAAGFAASLSGAPLPFVEPAILASVVIIGLLAATAPRAPASAGMAAVGFFAFFHGHAHGGELGAADALTFGIGFAVATALLHATGVGIALGLGRAAGVSHRFAGAATAAGGLWLALSA